MSSTLQIERRSYSILSLLAVSIVFIAILMIATHTISFNPKFVAIIGLVAQLFLIQRREVDINAGRRWRIWYAGIIAFLSVSFIDVVHFSPSVHEDVIRRESQAILGGFLLFNLLIIPVLISCVFKKASKG